MDDLLNLIGVITVVVGGLVLMAMLSDYLLIDNMFKALMESLNSIQGSLSEQAAEKVVELG